jgi:DNA repair protein RadC
MEYQVNVNFKFFANSLLEAEKKARMYVEENLNVKPLVNTICSPLDIAERCRDFRRSEKEYFVVFVLNTQNKVIDREVVSIGTLNQSLIHPRECFKFAIRLNANAVIFAHNHPSGSLEPSDEDLSVTKRLTDAGKLLGIEVLDHIIVTGESHKSLKEQKLI